MHSLFPIQFFVIAAYVLGGALLLLILLYLGSKLITYGILSARQLFAEQQNKKSKPTDKNG